MKNTKKESDVVFEICERMLDCSPERSYKRLNPALRSTLCNCIEADLPFLPNTFSRIYEKLRGNWWFGDGAGSHIGEHFYSLACRVDHASAQQSFEAFAERPGCIWEENVKTPYRLHVGAQFTWEGCHVTVTSMRKDSLVACTYKGHESTVRGINVGASFYAGDYFTVLSRIDNENAHTLRVTKSPVADSRVVDRRFVIAYTEIATLRRTAKARLKSVIDRIYASDPASKSEVDAINETINSERFRHFELEDIRAAFLKHRKTFADREKIEAWRKGKDGEWLDSRDIHLRIKDGRIECSNGNSIKMATAIAVLPIVLAHHGKKTALNLPIDSYAIESVDPVGVKIGCTMVPWSEIDYLARELKIAA